ncbi:MAG: glucans biosynthesis glucosyltransferase MdoH [Hyphomonadaceae bacterium]|nr:glucans biosynthesis glucosyltransferase MdoH [Hyphomonadaceae bacterium]
MPFETSITSDYLPAHAPLPMIEQPVSRPALGARWHDPRSLAWRRAGLFTATLALTGAAFMAPFDLFAGDGFTLVETAGLVLFGPLFVSIACWFCSALVGFYLLASQRHDYAAVEDLPAPSAGRRTALLAVIRNEQASAVYARLRAMDQALRARGASSAFDFFVLSDTNDPSIAAQEAVLAAQAQNGGGSAFYYRRRRDNRGRKAGNVADWVRNFGGAYDYMVVLDADSLMSAELLVGLTGWMDSRPDLGLIQTVPHAVHGESLFARHIQFGIRLYGRVACAGLAWWMGREGLYWGHNAMVRTRAFAESAGLPRLPGEAPFGGDVLSHDVVESFFMRRDGWGVILAPRLEGSYEEAPPTLMDNAARDARWCQGNFQHLSLLRAEGLHWLHRVQIGMAMMVYAAAPLWLAFLAVGVILRVQQGLPEPGAPWFEGGAERLLTLHWSIVMTVVMLFGPKLMGAALVAMNPAERRLFGGARKLTIGVAAEIVMSAVLAPLHMLSSCRAVAHTLFGFDNGWRPQRRRADGATPWGEAWRTYGWQSGAGLVLLFIAAPYSDLVIWMAPILIGLLFAAPLAALTASAQVGLWAREAGLFLTPEEVAPPPLLRGALAEAGALESPAGAQTAPTYA